MFKGSNVTGQTVIDAEVEASKTGDVTTPNNALDTVAQIDETKPGNDNGTGEIQTPVLSPNPSNFN